SVINISGMSGNISNVTVTLRGLSHTFPDDLDILLVGPGGQTLMLMSDAGGGPTSLNNVTFTLSDLAATAVPDNGPLTAGTFKPVDYVSADGADTFSAPAPAGPYGTNFAVFKNLAANGAWSLYVMDDGPGDSGSFSGGWSLTVSTATTTGAAPTISDIV